ncbi:MAG: hypothetical protein V4666_05305 [Bacteroidota bacterium]
MEPNNFDKDIQQKFNSRKIEPSAQAWDRLDAMLTVAEEKKPKNFFWLSIAATFLVFSGIGYLFFQQNQELEISQPTNEVGISKETPINEVENYKTNEITLSPEVENELAVSIPKTTNPTTEKVSKQNDNKKYKSELNSHKAVTEKLNELIAQNENKSEQNNQKPTYNNSNPEALLAEVQGNKKSNGNTNTYKSTLKVNPNDLLKSVESELDQSFKDKALRQFKQAKLAIANRNYN